MELKVGNLRRKHVKNSTWPKEKKLQVVTQYLALGNMKLVAATTGVDYGLIRQWKMQPWWKEFEREIRATENIALDSNLTKIVDKSLETVADRLENGDFIFDNKTGQIKRKPVNMKDAAKVSVDLLTKRELLRGNATNRSESAVIPMADQLKALADAFARMSQGLPPAEMIDVETVEINDGDVDDAVEMVQADGPTDGVWSDDQREDSPELDDEGGATRDDNPR
jgi:hypothetical protein